MKVCEANGHIEKSDNLSVSRFRILESSKAFEILSSGLYSDKVAAVIRELSTNAADSTVAAKSDKPFVIHLPNQFEPYFSIRDYGTGITPDNIKDVYTVYFKSDRDNSNDFTGCLGLGSKSPFSYVDQFTVDNYYNGSKTIFTCFLDEQSLPSISELHEEETTEPNGVEVRFPVDSEDFGEFADKASIILSRFQPRPTVVGNTRFYWIEYNYLVKNELVGVFNNGCSNSYVVMGNVAYQIRRNDFEIESEYAKNLIDNGCNIFLPIGSVEVTASREKLSYKPHTIKSLTEALNKIVESLKEQVGRFLESVTTLWQARSKYFEIRNSILGDFLPSTKLTFNGSGIDNVIVGFYEDVIKVETVELSKRYSGNHKLWHYDKDTICACNKLIFIADSPRSNERIREYMSRNCVDEAYVVKLSDEPIIAHYDKYVVETKSKHVSLRLSDDSYTRRPDDDSKELYWVANPPLASTGIMEVAIRTSTLPIPTRVIKKKASKGVMAYTPVLKFVPEGQPTADNMWGPERIKLSDGGIYIEILRYHITADPKHYWDDKTHPININYVVKAIKAITGDDTTVYGVRPSDRNRLDQTVWTHLCDYARTVIANNSKYLPLAIKLHYFSKFLLPSKRYEKFNASDFALYSPFREFIEFYKELIAIQKMINVKEYGNLLDLVDKEAFVKNKKLMPFDSAAADKKIMELYPLLAFIDSWSYVDKPIVDYVNMIDLKNKKNRITCKLSRDCPVKE